MPAVKDLFIALGLKMDDAAFAAADVAITGLKKGPARDRRRVRWGDRGLRGDAEADGRRRHETARTARQVGLTTQQLQGLRFAASDAGVGADELDGAMKALARSAYEASIHGAPPASRSTGSASRRLRHTEKRGRCSSSCRSSPTASPSCPTRSRRPPGRRPSLAMPAPR
jgi:hypothetical protein